MKKWIVNYNLEILTAILAVVFGVSLFFWDSHKNRREIWIPPTREGYIKP